MNALADPVEVQCDAEAQDFAKEILRDLFVALRGAYRLNEPKPLYKDYVCFFNFHYDPAPLELRRRYTLVGGGLKSIKAMQFGEDLNDAAPANKKNWLQLCSQEYLRNRPGQKKLTQYNCCLSVVLYVSPSPKLSRGAKTKWTTMYLPLLMDLPEPGVPKMALDPEWYNSFKEDLAGPGPGTMSNYIRTTFARAARNAKMPKRVYSEKDPRRKMTGGNLPDFFGEFAEIYSDDLDKMVAKEYPDLAGKFSSLLPPRVASTQLYRKKNKKKKKKTTATAEQLDTVAAMSGTQEVEDAGQEQVEDDDESSEDDVAELERQIRATLGSR
ncbi:hypothetical protein P7C70_g500, partial [Phenoliferia sp. Uapishka_3]